MVKQAKKLKPILMLLLPLLMILQSLSTSLPATNAAEYRNAPYDTWTLGPKGSWVKTQTAFLPQTVYNPDISGAQDMFIDSDSGNIYIADTLNKRIAVFDGDMQPLHQITDESLVQPSGVYVKHGKVYVADGGAKEVLIFDAQTLQLVQTIGRPTELLFGAVNKYVPQKLCVDARGNIYVTSDGAVDGVLQFNPDGALLGFIGANTTPTGFTTFIKELLFTDEQKAQYFNKIPPSPTFVTIGHNNLLYTVTFAATDGAIKKLNTSGKVIMTPVFNFENTVAAAVRDDEIIFSVSTSSSGGWVDIFDSYGELLFSFGPWTFGDITGIVRTPAAIALRGENFLVLDRTLNLVVEYRPTEFAKQVFEAVNYYKDGYYVEGMPAWERIIAQNSQFIISYRALAKANMRLGNYELALEQFRFSEDKDGYSDAFWEVRNAWIQRNTGYLILIILLLVAVVVAVKQVNKRTTVFAPVGRFWNRVRSHKLYQDLAYVKRYLRHPVNSCYQIKRRGKGSVLGSSILYLGLVAVYAFGIIVSGYLFEMQFTGVGAILMNTLMPVMLFVLASFFVTTIRDGEGSLKSIYISTAYALAPLILFMPLIFLLTNVLTYNEAFIITALRMAVFGYTAIMMFLNIKEIHNYSVGKTIATVLLTVFTIAIFILFVFIIYMLVMQEAGVIESVIREIIGK